MEYKVFDIDINYDEVKLIDSIPDKIIYWKEVLNDLNRYMALIEVTPSLKNKEDYITIIKKEIKYWETELKYRIGNSLPTAIQNDSTNQQTGESDMITYSEPKDYNYFIISHFKDIEKDLKSELIKFRHRKDQLNYLNTVQEFLTMERNKIEVRTFDNLNSILLENDITNPDEYIQETLKMNTGTIDIKIQIVQSLINKYSEAQNDGLKTQKSKINQCSDTFHFKFEPKQIELLWTALIESDFIASDTSIIDFTAVFSGEPIGNIKEPVKWVDKAKNKTNYNKTTIFDLISLITHNEHLQSDFYDKMLKCFSLNGNIIPKSSIKSSFSEWKNRKNKSDRTLLIEKIIDPIKNP